MKKNLITKVFLFLFTICFIGSCSNPSGNSGSNLSTPPAVPDPNAVPVIDTNVLGVLYNSESEICSAYYGYKGQLSATMSDGFSSTYTWTSSDPSKVRINSDGTINYLGLGNDSQPDVATITCTAANGKSTSIVCWSSYIVSADRRSESWNPGETWNVTVGSNSYFRFNYLTSTVMNDVPIVGQSTLPVNAQNLSVTSSDNSIAEVFIDNSFRFSLNCKREGDVTITFNLNGEQRTYSVHVTQTTITHQ